MSDTYQDLKTVKDFLCMQLMLIHARLYYDKNELDHVYSNTFYLFIFYNI